MSANITTVSDCDDSTTRSNGSDGTGGSLPKSWRSPGGGDGLVRLPRRRLDTTLAALLGEDGRASDGAGGGPGGACNGSAAHRVCGGDVAEGLEASEEGVCPGLGIGHH